MKETTKDKLAVAMIELAKSGTKLYEAKMRHHRFTVAQLRMTKDQQEDPHNSTPVKCE